MQGVEGASGARPGDEEPPGTTLLPPCRVAGSDFAQKGRQGYIPTKSQPLLKQKANYVGCSLQRPVWDPTEMFNH